MENLLIITTKKELKEILLEILIETDAPFSQDFKRLGKAFPEIEKDKISKFQASKLIGITIPTLNKLAAKGQFRQYSLGRRRYFLRSEVITALRNNAL